MRKKRISIAVAVAAGALAIVPAGASAHVTVHPGTAPADSYSRIDFRVPNEEDNANTTSIKVQFPAGIYSTYFEPVAGWKVTVKTTKLAQPVKMEDDTLTTETKEVDFTATGGGLKPGQFQDFGLSISTPNKPGEQLRFPAVQTYSNGVVARWIGAEGGDNPTPILTLTAAENGAMTGTTSGSGSTASSDSSSTSTVSWVALALGIIALAIGGVALAGSRRRAG